MDHLVFIQQNPLPFATLLGIQLLSTTPAKLFEGKSLTEQKTLLATLERSGAARYHAFASNEVDPHAREALLAAAV